MSIHNKTSQEIFMHFTAMHKTEKNLSSEVRKKAFIDM